MLSFVSEELTLQCLSWNDSRSVTYRAFPCSCTCSIQCQPQWQCKSSNAFDVSVQHLQLNPCEARHLNIWFIRNQHASRSNFSTRPLSSLSLSLLVLFPSSFICSMSNLSGSSGLWVWAYPLMILDGCCPSYQVSWRPLAVRKYVFAGEMPVAPAYASRPIHPASLWCIWLSGFPAGLELPASHCRDCRGKGIQKSREQKNMEIQGHLHLWWKGRHRYMQVVRQTDWLSLETKWDNDTYTRNAQIPAAHVLNMDTSK